MNDFTDRECKVIFAICLGLRNKDMVQHLGIIESTVQTIMCSIYDKAGVSSRLELHLFVKTALNDKLRRRRGV